MSDVDTAIKGTNAHTVITDIYNNPVTIDNNVAHLDGLMYEINSYVRRTGTWDSLVRTASRFAVARSSSTPLLPFLS